MRTHLKAMNTKETDIMLHTAQLARLGWGGGGFLEDMYELSCHLVLGPVVRKAFSLNGG